MSRPRGKSALRRLSTRQMNDAFSISPLFGGHGRQGVERLNELTEKTNEQVSPDPIMTSSLPASRPSSPSTNRHRQASRSSSLPANSSEPRRIRNKSKTKKHLKSKRKSSESHPKKAPASSASSSSSSISAIDTSLYDSNLINDGSTTQPIRTSNIDKKQTPRHRRAKSQGGKRKRPTAWNRSSLSSMTIDLDLNSLQESHAAMQHKHLESHAEVDSGSERHGIHRTSAKMMLLEEHNGIPLKETMKVLYSVRRMKFVWELIILVVSMVLFFIITATALNRRTSYEQQVAIQELLQDEEFAGSTYKKNFDEIRSIEEFWSWAEGPLVTNLYLTERPGAASSNNRSALPEAEQDYVASYLRIVGGIQIRQFRVASDSCKERRRVDTNWGHRLDTKDGSCYNSFGNDKDWKESMSWAEKIGEPEPEGPHSYLYGHWGHCDSRKCSLGPLQDEVDYGSGGSAVNIPPPSKLLPLNVNATYSAATLIAKLKALTYFDRSTRAIVVECVFFNTNTETMSTALFIVEQYASGLIESSVKYRHTKISVFDSKTSVMRIACEIAFLVLFFYQFQRELKRIVFTRPFSRYLFNPFSWLEIAYFTFNILFFTKWYTYVLAEERINFDVNTKTFVPMWNVADSLMKTYQFAGWAMLTVSFKVLRLMSLNRRMSVLWQALAESAADVVAFMLSFFILLMGFGYMAYMMWGVNTKVFTTLYTSTFTLLRYWIDEFPYENLYDSQPDMYYSFFIPFSLLLTLVVQNVFVAIILNSFTKIHTESSHEHWKKDLTHVSYELYKRISLTFFIFRMRCVKQRRCFSWWRRIWRCSACCCTRKTSLKHVDGENLLNSWYSLADVLATEEDIELAESAVGERQLQRYQVYSCELEFFAVMAKAARITRRNVMAGGNISSLYEYFRRAYREHPADVTSFMSIQELCAITKPKSMHRGSVKNQFGHKILQNCSHENCIASRIIECYNEFKSVLVIGGKERESKMVQRPSEIDMRAQRFDVIKTNNMGRQQRRILIVDQNRREIRSFDTRMRLHVILPLKHLQQLENLEAAPCTLELSFKEGVYSYCELEFTSRHERTRFIQSIMKQHEAVEEDKTTEADKDPLVRLQRQVEDLSMLLISLHQKLDKKTYTTKKSTDEIRVEGHSEGVVPSIPSREARAAALRLISRLPTADRWVNSKFKRKRAYYPAREMSTGRHKSKRSTHIEETLSVEKFMEKSRTSSRRLTSLTASQKKLVKSLMKDGGDSSGNGGESKHHGGSKSKATTNRISLSSTGIEMMAVRASPIETNLHGRSHATAREAKGDREVKDDVRNASAGLMSERGMEGGGRGRGDAGGSRRGFEPGHEGLVSIKADRPQILHRQRSSRMAGSGLGDIAVSTGTLPARSSSESNMKVLGRQSVASLRTHSPEPQESDGEKSKKTFKL